ncbi:MAG: hypothetical protein ACP6IY_20090 [Promethearchaeia archaeon]
MVILLNYLIYIILTISERFSNENEKNRSEDEKKARFTAHDIPLLAALIAILFVIEFVWVFRTSGYLIFLVQGVYVLMIGIIIVTAAIVINKKFTLLIMGAIHTLINLPFAHLYGEPLAALSYLIWYGILELFIYLSEPYGENHVLNIIAMGVSHSSRIL